MENRNERSILILNKGKDEILMNALSYTIKNPKSKIRSTSDIKEVIKLILESKVGLIITYIHALALLEISDNVDFIEWIKNYAPTEIPIILIGKKENPPKKYRAEMYLQEPVNSIKNRNFLKRKIEAMFN